MVRESGQDGPDEWTFENRTVLADLHDLPRLSNIRVPESIWRTIRDDTLVFPLQSHARLSILHEIGGTFVYFSRNQEKRLGGSGCGNGRGLPPPAAPGPLGGEPRTGLGQGLSAEPLPTLLALWGFIRVLLVGYRGVPGGHCPIFNFLPITWYTILFILRYTIWYIMTHWCYVCRRVASKAVRLYIRISKDGNRSWRSIGWICESCQEPKPLEVQKSR